MRPTSVGGPVRALVAALLLAATPTAAWDNQGHMLTGMLAHDRLATADPQAVAAVEQLMAAHPDGARFRMVLGEATGPERARRMFAWMARWPDDVRKTPQDRPEWHYAVKVVHGWTFLGWYTAGDAFEAHAANLAIARDRTAPAAARAIALCWVFHILGDMHQPLHRGHRMDMGWLKTDRAGTVAYVRRVAGGPVMDLHESWDSAASVPGPDQKAALRLLPTLTAVAARLPADRAPETLDAWAAESEELARTVAYAGSALGATPDKASAPVLDAAYQARAHDFGGADRDGGRAAGADAGGPAALNHAGQGMRSWRRPAAGFPPGTHSSVAPSWRASALTI